MKIFGDLFEQPKIRTPKDVVVKFKSYIENESRGSLTFVIDESNSLNKKIITCSISVKSINTNYSYNLMYISYDLLMYPCVITADELVAGDDELMMDNYLHELGGARLMGISAASEEELENIFLRLLKTDRARAIIRAIYSQE